MVAASALVSIVPQAPARGRSFAVDLMAMEFLFEPNNVSVFEPGQIAFVVRNIGAIDHNLVIESLSGKTVAEIPDVEPGRKAETVVALPPGVYTLYCSLPGHRGAGMKGILRVGPPPPGLDASRGPLPMPPSAARPAPLTPPPAPPAPPAPSQPAHQAGSPVPAHALPAAQAGRVTYRVQAGAFRRRGYADQLVRQLQAKGYQATVAGGPLLRVWVGPATGREAAQRLAAELRAKGFDALAKPVP